MGSRCVIETASEPSVRRSTSSTLGGALGLAIFSAIAAGRSHHLLAAGASQPAALTSGEYRSAA
jgi:hypothetical protein